MNSAYSNKLKETLLKLNPPKIAQEEFFEKGATLDEKTSNYGRNFGTWKKDCLNWRTDRTKRRQNAQRLQSAIRDTSSKVVMHQEYHKFSDDHHHHVEDSEDDEERKVREE